MNNLAARMLKLKLKSSKPKFGCRLFLWSTLLSYMSTQVLSSRNGWEMIHPWQELAWSKVFISSIWSRSLCLLPWWFSQLLLLLQRMIIMVRVWLSLSSRLTMGSSSAVSLVYSGSNISPRFLLDSLDKKLRPQCEL